MADELKALSCTCDDCGDWFAVEEEAFNDKRVDKIKCPYCHSDNVRTLSLIIYR